MDEYYIYKSPGGGSYKVPINNDKPTQNDEYWQQMEERKQQRRDWEDRGEPVGW